MLCLVVYILEVGISNIGSDFINWDMVPHGCGYCQEFSEDMNKKEDGGVVIFGKLKPGQSPLEGVGAGFRVSESQSNSERRRHHL